MLNSFFLCFSCLIDWCIYLIILEIKVKWDNELLQLLRIILFLIQFDWPQIGVLGRLKAYELVNGVKPGLWLLTSLVDWPIIEVTVVFWPRGHLLLIPKSCINLAMSFLREEFFSTRAPVKVEQPRWTGSYFETFINFLILILSTLE